VCLAAGSAAGVFKPGNHGSTFGGNPLACAAALATLAIIESENLMENAVKIGDFIRSELKVKLAAAGGVREVRGTGLMIGIELDYPCGALTQQALDAGLLINVTHDNVIRLLPPLALKREEAEQLISILVPLIAAFLADQGAPQLTAQTV
jgi:acetylornithine/N-succinyldiaminopimelate aminotransferase